MKFLKQYVLSAITASALFSLSACSSASGDDISSAETGEVVAGSRLIISLGSSSSSSRADAGTIPGTEAESKISTFSVYFADTNDKITNVLNYDASSLSSNIVVIPLDKENIPVSNYHIYVCANPTSEIKTQAVKGANMNDLMGQVAAVSELTTANQFVMFGQVSNSSTGKLISFVQGETTDTSVSLTRVVSKVLVTAATDANGYVTDGYGASFISLSDIHFTLQTTNTRYYYLPKLDGSDPNYDMSTLLTTSFSYQSGVSSQFLDKDLYTYGTDGTWMAAEKYDATKLSGTSGYTNGLYCLENTISDVPSTFDLTGVLKQSVPQMVATYLRIGLKAVPCTIDGVTYTTAAEASTHLTGGNFYTYSLGSTEAEQRLAFSSETALKNHFSSIDKDKVVSHNISTVYYYNVFVNGYDFSSANSSLVRNHYYIANVTKVYTPYYDKVMEINTKAIPWTEMGTTTYDVDTSGSTSKQ